MIGIVHLFFPFPFNFSDDVNYPKAESSYECRVFKTHTFKTGLKWRTFSTIAIVAILPLGSYSFPWLFKPLPFALFIFPENLY